MPAGSFGMPHQWQLATGVGDHDAMGTARIVHIIDHLGLGGVQTFLRTVLPQLPKHRFAPMIVNLRHATPLSRSFEAAGIPVISLGLPRWSFRQYVALIAVLRHLRPAVVHTHLTVGKLIGRLAAIHAQVPYIIVDDQLSVSQDTYDLPPAIVLAYRLLEPLLEPYTTLYLSPSSTVQEASCVVKRWPADKCRVLYNAIDCARFTPVADRAGARAALHLPDRVTVTTFGRLVPQKRFADVVAVAQHVTRRYPNVQFLIAGSGPLEDQIRRWIRAAQLDDRVLMLGFRRDTAHLLAATDIYLSASAGEAFSVAILEALASGCPVVATTAGGTIEQVLPGINGYLARVGDIEGLANAVAHLIQHPDQRRAFGEAGRRYACERFDAPIIAARLADLYTEVLQAARGRPALHLHA